METRQTRKTYTSPQSEIYRLPNHFTLLAGSGEGVENDGYGEGIGDGDNGWH